MIVILFIFTTKYDHTVDITLIFIVGIRNLHCIMGYWPMMLQIRCLYVQQTGPYQKRTSGERIPNITVISYNMSGVSHFVNGSRKAFEAHLLRYQLMTLYLCVFESVTQTQVSVAARQICLTADSLLVGKLVLVAVSEVLV